MIIICLGVKKLSRKSSFSYLELVEIEKIKDFVRKMKEKSEKN